ncbi:phage shock protein a suppresses sigma54-dependent transcription [Leptolyngbya sp. Heron Island J]|uniref:lecithin retinol acyltransferase family protein n=1 Tax=Leptolyngbya sp. Heron Island J TaxID=1385935 RepID=UPI0003B94EE9|nr:lecithin retinol acyltransferase family protein [Leptolyngbya sp. Heron Island J]ESA36778.1 phage shock protein a suppresses sigma54-dependent transcription [Leptolyngbya sp. Heron Island J]
MARGDQVYVMRDVMGVPYKHHGIDCGDGSIIHYRKVGTATVACTSFDGFARGNPVYTLTQPVSFIPDVVLSRAESRLGEQRYNLFFNNCEHFANWCKTGKNVSPQLNEFGLRADQIKLPRGVTRQAAQQQSPQAILDLFTRALENIAIATNTVLPEYEQAQADSEQWKKVAQAALNRGRDDLARAALYKRRDAKKKAEALQQQLQDLSDLQISIQTDQTLALKRLSQSEIM